MEENKTNVIRGKFIVIEGIDKAGKTTLSNHLIKTINCVRVAFPDRNTPSGQKINEFLKTGNYELNQEDTEKYNFYLKHFHKSNESKNLVKFWKMQCLFYENRVEKQEFIKSKLDEGVNIICDRYSISGIVYSSANGIDMDYCINMESDLIQPDITIFLNVLPKQASDRCNDTNEIYENLKFQTKVYEKYQYFKDKMVFIEGKEEDVYLKAIKHINKH